MEIKWLSKAVNDLESLRQYIYEDNPVAANKVITRIIESLSHLLNHSHMGRPGRLHNTREWIVSNTPYIVAYRVKNQIVEILRIIHCARKWPEELE